MNPYQFALPLPNGQIRQDPNMVSQLQMLQLQQLNQLSPQYMNPMLLNQFLMNMNQQFQGMQMIMVPRLQGPILQSASNNSSTRTIVMEDHNIKLEENVEKVQKLPPVKEEPQKQLDIEAISTELRQLIKYLSQEENPSKTYIEENIKLLPKVNAQIIPIIIERHQSQKKTKEEQIKFVLRKCFKFLKSKLDINEVIITPLEMEKRLYKEYFDGDEEMIPFRENSYMKTMNAQYLKKIFLSERFVQGFREYLEHFDSIWDEENEEKVENMVKQVIKLIQQNRVEKLYTYRRIPWVASVKDKCKSLAQAMLHYAPNNDSQLKQIKKNEPTNQENTEQDHKQEFKEN